MSDERNTKERAECGTDPEIPSDIGIECSNLNGKLSTEEIINLINVNGYHNKYTAEELIEDLMAEIQKYSEVLTILFPKRLFKKDSRFEYDDAKYSLTMLSSFWEYSEGYVDKLFTYYRGDKNYRIPGKALLKLKEIIHDKLGERGSICLEIIDGYEKFELDFKEFFLSLRFELGRVSGQIPFTQDEATQIFGFDVESKLTDIRNNRHNQANYRFSLWRLNDMIRRITLVLHENAKKCHELIQKYNNLNKDLKEYNYQQHNVGNPHYFEDILPGDLNKAYIFGFLGHDGYTSGGRIGLRINPDDKIIIDKLIRLIDLDMSKVKVRPETTLLLYKGERKEYHSLKLEFGCKPMVEELEELGDIGSGSDKKEIPPVIRELVEKAEQRTLDERIWSDWRDTPEGKTALVWLLGTYDADGSFMRYYSGMIISSHKSYLEEIKELFDIDTKVYEVKEPGFREVFDKVCFTKGAYSLSISSRNVMIKMMESYWYSLDRKRPEKYKLSSSDLDNYLGSFKGSY